MEVDEVDCTCRLYVSLSDRVCVVSVRFCFFYDFLCFRPTLSISLAQVSQIEQGGNVMLAVTQVNQDFGSHWVAHFASRAGDPLIS
jgi:hypothetical protein